MRSVNGGTTAWRWGSQLLRPALAATWCRTSRPKLAEKRVFSNVGPFSMHLSWLVFFCALHPLLALGTICRTQARKERKPKLSDAAWSSDLFQLLSQNAKYSFYVFLYTQEYKKLCLFYWPVLVLFKICSALLSVNLLYTKKILSMHETNFFTFSKMIYKRNKIDLKNIWKCIMDEF